MCEPSRSCDRPPAPATKLATFYELLRVRCRRLALPLQGRRRLWCGVAGLQQWTWTCAMFQFITRQPSLVDRRSSCVTSFRVPMRTKTKRVKRRKKKQAECSCLASSPRPVCTFCLLPQVGCQRAVRWLQSNNKIEYEVI